MMARRRTVGPARPDVLRMAAPLVVSFVLRGAFTLVDTAYAAWLGDPAVAAIGLTVPFEFLMIAVWVGLSTGLTSYLSQAMGARRGEQVEQYLASTWRLVLVASPMFLALGAAIWWLAPLMNLEAETERAFRIYGSVLVGGSALTAFWSVIPDSIVKAHQDTRSTMWAGILASIVNVLLNTWFVFVFHWGVFGIALSTVLGRIASLAYALHRARVHERRRRATDATPLEGRDPKPYRSLLSLAIPASITFALMAGETGVVNFLLAGTPEPVAAIAAWAIYYRVFLFLLNPAIATAVAMLPYSAVRFGEGELEGIRQGLRKARLWSAGYALLVVTPLLELSAPWLADLLAESERTASFTTFGLRLLPLAVVVTQPFLLCRPVFEGMGRGRPGMTMAFIRYLLLAAPGAWAGMRVARLMGMPSFHGLVLGLLAVSTVSSAGFVLWLRSALASWSPASGSSG